MITYNIIGNASNPNYNDENEIGIKVIAVNYYGEEIVSTKLILEKNLKDNYTSLELDNITPYLRIEIPANTYISQFEIVREDEYGNTFKVLSYNNSKKAFYNSSDVKISNDEDFKAVIVNKDSIPGINYKPTLSKEDICNIVYFNTEDWNNKKCSKDAIEELFSNNKASAMKCYEEGLNYYLYLVYDIEDKKSDIVYKNIITYKFIQVEKDFDFEVCNLQTIDALSGPGEGKNKGIVLDINGSPYDTGMYTQGDIIKTPDKKYGISLDKASTIYTDTLNAPIKYPDDKGKAPEK